MQKFLRLRADFRPSNVDSKIVHHTSRKNGTQMRNGNDRKWKKAARWKGTVSSIQSNVNEAKTRNMVSNFRGCLSGLVVRALDSDNSVWGLIPLVTCMKVRGALSHHSLVPSLRTA